MVFSDDSSDKRVPVIEDIYDVLLRTRIEQRRKLACTSVYLDYTTKDVKNAISVARTEQTKLTL